MTRLRLDYVHEYLDRHGKLRRYFRRPGFKQIPLPGFPGSDEFMTAYQRALDLAPRIEIGAGRTTPGTVDALIVHYLKSDAFTKALAPETQRMRRNILDRFRIKHGAKRVITLERRNVAKIIESKRPYAQKNWLKTLRGLMLRRRGELSDRRSDERGEGGSSGGAKHRTHDMGRRTDSRLS
jgi:hypothetical protein